MTTTPAPWNYAADSNGKVRHSNKACVFANIDSFAGRRIEKVAAQIPNWDDAMLIAAAPDLLAALQAILAANDAFRAQLPQDWEGDPVNDACVIARAVLAKAIRP